MPSASLTTPGVPRVNTFHSSVTQVQENIDRRNGLTLRPRQGEFPAERVQQFAHSLVDPTVEESVIRRRARSGTENITLSFHDDSVRENAKFRNDAGLTCYIERIGSSCCDWCTEVAGKYLFGTQPKDIFRRHDNCDCVIFYDNKVLRGKLNEKGESTKTWEEVPDTERVNYTPERLSRQQAEKLQNQKLSQIRGLKFNSSSIDNSGGSGIIELRDNNNVYKPVTQRAIDNVPKLDIFDNDEKNIRHQQACQDLLSEVMKHSELPIGTEFSIRYDIDMNPIKNETYRQGTVGSVGLDDAGIPFHAFHNHGSNETFSVTDMMKLSDVDNMLSLTVAGNLGNNYLLSKTSKFDKFGYKDYLSSKSKEVFFSYNDFDFSFESMSDKSQRDKLNEALAALNSEQISKLKSSMVKKCEEIAEGGKVYGVEYKKARLAD